MKLRLSFGHTREELFLVTSGLARGGSRTFTVTPYEHEDVFLGLLMTATLKDRELFDTVHAVLLTINDPVFPQRWADVDLDREQIGVLGLNVSGLDGELPRRTVGAQGLMGLHELLEMAPTPLVMLVGPEHRFAFINTAYVRMIRRSGAESVLGKAVRHALPELKGQPFFTLLDQVYQTGVAFVGRELKAMLRNEITGGEEELFFDFVYQPIQNAAGAVEGIMVQATDVTESVLERQVGAEREAKLFRQWTELEAIYRTAPIGLSLIDARSFRFLRTNESVAAMHGCRVEELVGLDATVVLRSVVGVRALLERAAKGETLTSIEVQGELPSRPGVTRSWNTSMTPIFNASGEVTAITTSVVETTGLRKAEARVLEGEKTAAASSLAESFANQIAGPLEKLQRLLGTAQGENRRDEAREALEVAVEELDRIAGIAAEMARRYGVESAKARGEIPVAIGSAP